MIGTRSDTVQEVFWLIGRIFADAEIFHDTTKKTTKKKNTRPKISPLSISSTKIVLVKGQSRKLTVKGGAGIVSWGSSNTAVAGVSAGKVVAKGKAKQPLR